VLLFHYGTRFYLLACWCTDAPHLIRLASCCMHSS